MFKLFKNRRESNNFLNRQHRRWLFFDSLAPVCLALVALGLLAADLSYFGC